MGMLRIRLVDLWDKTARYVPLVGTAKHYLCVMRWAAYEKRIRQYKNLANSPLIEPKVLVLMDAGIGNAVEATPLVQAIRMLWPKAEITIRPPSGGLFDNWCVVDHTADSPQALKSHSFTHTFSSWGGSIARNKGYCDLGQIHHTEEGLNLPCVKPEREYNMDMLRRLGYEGPTPPLYVSLQKPKEAVPSSPLQICLVPGGTPTHKWRNRRWPYFEQLGQTLLREYHSAQICVIGTTDDYLPEGLFTSSRVVDLRGRLTLSETAWVLCYADLAIGNDCGPMHIADAVQTPSIVIFGPTCEVKNGPAYKSVPVRHKVPCAPCQYGKLLLTCKNPICMKDLRPDVVLERANRLLETAGNP